MRKKNLIKAIEKGASYKKIEKIINSGVDINARDELGRTPLMYAIKHGYYDIVDLLVRNGADVNATTNFNWTPLSFAINYKQSNIAIYLISHGADINKPGYYFIMDAVSNGLVRVVEYISISEYNTLNNNNKKKKKIA